MFRVEAAHFWFVGTRRVVMDWLVRGLGRHGDGARVLDLGCGTGYTLTRLPSPGGGWGIDRSLYALTLAARRGLVGRLVQGDVRRLPFADAAFDAVLALDVLEHVADEHRAASELARTLCPGGCAVVTVPAFPSLWSAHDEALSHMRRYRLAEITAVLESAGLLVERASYYNFWLFPVVAAVRWLGRLRRRGGPQTDVRMPPAAINRALAAVLSSERYLLRRLSLPVGVSCILLARRPSPGGQDTR